MAVSQFPRTGDHSIRIDLTNYTHAEIYMCDGLQCVRRAPYKPYILPTNQHIVLTYNNQNNDGFGCLSTAAQKAAHCCSTEEKVLLVELQKHGAIYCEKVGISVGLTEEATKRVHPQMQEYRNAVDKKIAVESGIMLSIRLYTDDHPHLTFYYGEDSPNKISQVRIQPVPKDVYLKPGFYVNWAPDNWDDVESLPQEYMSFDKILSDGVSSCILDGNRKLYFSTDKNLLRKCLAEEERLRLKKNPEVIALIDEAIGNKDTELQKCNIEIQQLKQEKLLLKRERDELKYNLSEKDRRICTLVEEQTARHNKEAEANKLQSEVVKAQLEKETLAHKTSIEATKAKTEETKLQTTQSTAKSDSVDNTIKIIGGVVVGALAVAAAYIKYKSSTAKEIISAINPFSIGKSLFNRIFS